MNSGDLDRRIVIQSFTETRDDWNHPTKTWSTFATRWAMKVDDLGSERSELDQQVGIMRTLFKIRYTSGVNVSMRVLYESKYYYITAVKELGRREGMMLVTEIRD
jgi:SPP1 family predicted phage head-tail adaptor